MKDAFYVLFAAIGLLLVGVGLAQIREHQRSRTRPAAFEQMTGQPLFGGAPFSHPNYTADSTVPAESVLYLLLGYLLQVVGCGLYADNRGRSALYGLLGLLSPIGYVFLSVLRPSTRLANSKAANTA